MEGKWVPQTKPGLGLIHIMMPYPSFKSSILGSCTCTLSQPWLVCEWIKRARRKHVCWSDWLLCGIPLGYTQEKQQSREKTVFQILQPVSAGRKILLLGSTEWNILSAPDTDTASFMGGLPCPTSFADSVKNTVMDAQWHFARLHGLHWETNWYCLQISGSR